MMLVSPVKKRPVITTVDLVGCSDVTDAGLTLFPAIFPT
jgi:hypothetical protein